MISGIKEPDFWHMSFAEIKRYLVAENERYERERKEQATWIWMLADLIGFSAGRFITKAKYPSIGEYFPFFAQEEEEAKTKRSTANFMAFATQWNRRYNNDRNISDPDNG